MLGSWQLCCLIGRSVGRPGLFLAKRNNRKLFAAVLACLPLLQTWRLISQSSKGPRSIYRSRELPAIGTK